MPDDKAKRRENERAYWEEHGIDEEPGQEVEVHVKKPLSVMLSLRLDPEHYEKLKTLAEREERGVTTLARLLLQQSVEQDQQG